MTRDGATSERGRHVLVVDDEQDILAFVQAALEQEGYSVSLATDGREALTAIATRQPDLMLLDVNMPDVDGWAVLRELRAAAGPQTPVVVMTAGYNAQTQALGSGAQGYLGKPFELDDLLSAAAAHVGLPMEGSFEAARSEAP
jgi:two-component system response regulator MprA